MVSFMSVKRPTVIDIIKKFAATINYLRVCGEHASDLIEAVSLVPYANHLELVLLQNNTQPSKKARHEIENNEELNPRLNLYRLRKLNIERSKHEFVVMFNRLPADVLIELTLDQDNLCKLTNLFKNQTKIKKLTILNDDSYKYPIVDEDLFNNLQIEFLEWHAYSFKHNIQFILAKQTNLKVLKLIDGKIGKDLMNVITNQLPKLEILSIFVPHIPIAAFKNINKLKNLKELTLQSNEEHNVIHFEAFATLDNSRITILNIKYYYDISDDLIDVMAKSLPNLKIVSFHCDYNVDTFHAIMKSFNYVEVLQLDALNIDFDNHKGNNSTLIKNGCANNKLIELKISYPLSYTMKFVKKLVMDYPHLKKLIIKPTNRNIEKQFEMILKAFKEMESLSILRDSLERRIYDLNLITKYGKNLKFVALLDMDVFMLDIQIDENIKKIFGVITNSRINGLKMAVDTKTMKIEREYIERCT